ncbi:MAG TPA: DsbA family oxidoreductase [Nocardioides sp.]|nr:DsbA family oxidoreductase [Nocardioides sp.]
MRIEVWSDVVCPWCYIGKRRLERALEGFEHAEQVEVVYRSFELDPSAPKDATEPVVEVLARKYGGGVENARTMMARVSEVAAGEGLEYHLDRTLRGNTVDAHRLLHLALDEHGLRAQAALKEALLAAYFTRVEDVADVEVLRKVATGAGLDPARVDEVLASDEYAAAVREDVADARALGATGVPFFVVDRRYGIAGAQPVEVLREVLHKAWGDAQPSVAMVGADGDVCGPEGCY